MGVGLVEGLAAYAAHYITPCQSMRLDMCIGLTWITSILLLLRRAALIRN